MHVLNILSFFLCLINEKPTFADFVAQDHDGNDVQFVNVKKSDNLKEARRLVIYSFLGNYRDIPLAELDPSFSTVGNVMDWFGRGFDREEDALLEDKNKCIQAFQNKRVIGFACFQKEPLEDKAVYVRLLAIHPDFQGKGIGKLLLFSVKTDKDLYPDTQALFLITRFKNEKAIGFYKKQGFIQSSYIHEEYDKTKYVGFEWRETNSTH